MRYLEIVIFVFMFHVAVSLLIASDVSTTFDFDNDTYQYLLGLNVENETYGTPQIGESNPYEWLADTGRSLYLFTSVFFTGVVFPQSTLIKMQVPEQIANSIGIIVQLMYIIAIVQIIGKLAFKSME